MGGRGAEALQKEGCYDEVWLPEGALSMSNFVGELISAVDSVTKS